MKEHSMAMAMMTDHDKAYLEYLEGRERALFEAAFRALHELAHTRACLDDAIEYRDSCLLKEEREAASASVNHYRWRVANAESRWELYMAWLAGSHGEVNDVREKRKP